MKAAEMAAIRAATAAVITITAMVLLRITAITLRRTITITIIPLLLSSRLLHRRLHLHQIMTVCLTVTSVILRKFSATAMFRSKLS